MADLISRVCTSIKETDQALWEKEKKIVVLGIPKIKVSDSPSRPFGNGMNYLPYPLGDLISILKCFFILLLLLLAATASFISYLKSQNRIVKKSRYSVWTAPSRIRPWMFAACNHDWTGSLYFSISFPDILVSNRESESAGVDRNVVAPSRREPALHSIFISPVAWRSVLSSRGRWEPAADDRARFWLNYCSCLIDLPGYNLVKGASLSLLK